MKRVLVLSDIHTGNKLAVSPPEFTLQDGGTYTANRVQRALFRAWSEVVSEWKNPDILVINGEPIDGQGKFDSGVEQWTTDYMEQINASVQLVKMFNAKKIYVTRGSNYHVSIGGVSVEEVFGEKVGAELVNGSHVVPELFLDVEGVVLNLAHHIQGSSSGWNYRSTPPAKEMMLGQLNASHKWNFDILIRSHNHYAWYVGSTTKMAILTPAWKLQDWLAMKRGSMGTIPDIGATRLTIEKGKPINHSLEFKTFKLNEWKPPMVKA